MSPTDLRGIQTLHAPKTRAHAAWLNLWRSMTDFNYNRYKRAYRAINHIGNSATPRR